MTIDMKIPPQAIESSVLKTVVSVEKQVNSKSWETLPEDDIFLEIVANILGSQVHHETACYYLNQLQKNGLIRSNLNNITLQDYERQITEILVLPPKNNINRNHSLLRYRYPKTKANYISRTAFSIYGRGESFKNLLNQCNSAKEARAILIKKVIGMGPKQSSLFLRNIGFTDDLAILDVHVLRYMFINKIHDHDIRSVSHLTRYEIVENKLKQYADKVKHKISNLDLAIWIVMRVYMREFV